MNLFEELFIKFEIGLTLSWEAKDTWSVFEGSRQVHWGECCIEDVCGLLQLAAFTIHDLRFPNRVSGQCLKETNWSWLLHCSLSRYVNQFREVITSRRLEERFTRSSEFWSFTISIQLNCNSILLRKIRKGFYLVDGNRDKLFEEVRFFRTKIFRHRSWLCNSNLNDRGESFLFGNSLMINEVVVLLRFSQRLFGPS